MRCVSLVVSLAVLAVGCGEDEAVSSSAPTPAVQAQPSIEPTDDDDIEPEPPEDPGAPLDVDAMSDDELEAACFAGSTAACDRLGH